MNFILLDGNEPLRRRGSTKNRNRMWSQPGLAESRREPASGTARCGGARPTIAPTDCCPSRTINASTLMAQNWGINSKAATHLKDHAGAQVTTSELAKASGINRLTQQSAIQMNLGVAPPNIQKQQRI